MDWNQAKAGTLAKYRAILKGVGTATSVDLLRDLNEMHDICEKALEEAAKCGGSSPCVYCLACQQLGGCGGIRGVLSNAVILEDWKQVALLIENIIRDLEGLRIASETR